MGKFKDKIFNADHINFADWFTQEQTEITPELRQAMEDFQNLLKNKPEYQKSVPISFALSLAIYQFAKTYCKLQVKGTENIPFGSRFVWTHNHSGWFALDAILVGHIIARANRVDKFDWSFDSMGPLSILKHLIDVPPGDWGVTFWNKTIMKVPGLSAFLKAMHGFPVDVLKNPEMLKEYRIFATPAEGEDGNCKSSFTDLYKLRRFRSGVARLALTAKVDYVSPVMIVGPEETFPCLGKFSLLKNVIGSVLPIPLLVPPIPVGWIVKFLPPISVSEYHQNFKPGEWSERNVSLIDELTSHIKNSIQHALKEELADRKPFKLWFL